MWQRKARPPPQNGPRPARSENHHHHRPSDYHHDYQGSVRGRVRGWAPIAVRTGYAGVDETKLWADALQVGQDLCESLEWDRNKSRREDLQAETVEGTLDAFVENPEDGAMVLPATAHHLCPAWEEPILAVLVERDL